MALMGLALPGGRVEAQTACRPIDSDIYNAWFMASERCDAARGPQRLSTAADAGVYGMPLGRGIPKQKTYTYGINVGRRNLCRRYEFSGLIVLHRLEDLLVRIHHERTVLRDWLA